MEEQKRRKEEEVRRKKEEENREEERVQRERIKLDEEFKQEEQKKKAKVVEFQQANANIVQQKGPTIKNKTEREDFMAEKPSVRGDLFGKGASVVTPLDVQP